MVSHDPRFRRKLRSVGVELIDPSHVWLRCVECGTRWSPNLRRRGRLPRRYWWCPRGCNVPDDRFVGY